MLAIPKAPKLLIGVGLLDVMMLSTEMFDDTRSDQRIHRRNQGERERGWNHRINVAGVPGESSERRDAERQCSNFFFVDPDDLRQYESYSDSD